MTLCSLSFVSWSNWTLCEQHARLEWTCLSVLDKSKTEALRAITDLRRRSLWWAKSLDVHIFSHHMLGLLAGVCQSSAMDDKATLVKTVSLGEKCFLIQRGWRQILHINYHNHSMNLHQRGQMPWRMTSTWRSLNRLHHHPLQRHPLQRYPLQRHPLQRHPCQQSQLNMRRWRPMRTRSLQEHHGGRRGDQLLGWAVRSSLSLEKPLNCVSAWTIVQTNIYVPEMSLWLQDHGNECQWVTLAAPCKLCLRHFMPGQSCAIVSTDWIFSGEFQLCWHVSDQPDINHWWSFV